jgi:hypothetical protein
MGRDAGKFTQAIAAGAVCLAGSLSVPALAEGASPPVFTPNPSAGWFAYTREFIAPASGAGPVVQDSAHPYVSNDEFRATGKQPTFHVGNLNNPILQPWARDAIRKSNEAALAGKPTFSLHASCYPIGVPVFLLEPMTRPMFIVQGPKEVVMILESFSDVRRIYLADKHSANLRPSWYGDSIGHYEGDTLVVDTIGFNDKTVVDGFHAAHRCAPHGRALSHGRRRQDAGGEHACRGSGRLHDAVECHPALSALRGDREQDFRRFARRAGDSGARPAERSDLCRESKLPGHGREAPAAGDHARFLRACGITAGAASRDRRKSR